MQSCYKDKIGFIISFIISFTVSYYLKHFADQVLYPVLVSHAVFSPH